MSDVGRGEGGGRSRGGGVDLWKELLTLDSSNLSMCGHLLGPDQNGAPDEVICENKPAITISANTGVQEFQGSQRKTLME